MGDLTSRGEEAGSAAGPSTAANSTGRTSKPISVLVIGMAGSGKTTLMQRINSHLHQHKTPSYILNLDPAVAHIPYGANIDIRDTVQYKKVMAEYNLGPNGAIMTSLNLFTTKFDQVLGLITKPRDPPLQYVFTDTPGQIEVFTWSASGAIITEAMAAEMSTVVLFVVDTARCQSARTFMSNMLQACSILYKTRLPLVVAFNKIDVARHDVCVSWMQDYEEFQRGMDNDETYAATLARSLALALEEFYSGLRHAGVSAVTGEGVDELFAEIEAAAQQYWDEYVPDLEARKRERDEKEKRRRETEMDKLRQDIASAKEGERIVVHKSGPEAGTEVP